MKIRQRTGRPGLYGLAGFLLFGLSVQTRVGAQDGADSGPDTGQPVCPAPSLPAGTLLKLSPLRPVTSRTARPGDPVHFRLREAVYAGAGEFIPAGTVVEGSILRVRRPGRIARRSRLRIHLDRLVTRGMALDLACTDVTLKGATTLGTKAVSGMTTLAAGSVSPVAGAVVGVRLLRRGPEIRIGPRSLFLSRLLQPLEIPVQLTRDPRRSPKRQEP